MSKPSRWRMQPCRWAKAGCHLAWPGSNSDVGDFSAYRHAVQHLSAAICSTRLPQGCAASSAARRSGSAQQHWLVMFSSCSSLPCCCTCLTGRLACLQEQLSDALKHMLMQGQDSDIALIIDGKALIHGLADDTKARLLEVGGSCNAAQALGMHGD